MIKKLVLKMIIFPVILLGGYGYIMYLQTGKAPFFSGSGNEATQTMKSLRDKITNTENFTKNNKPKLFKWKDKNGQWHFGDQPPEDATTTSINYDKNRNIISSIKVTKTTAGESKFGTPSSSDDQPANKLTGSPSDAYNLENISQTINDAKNLQKVLNDRMKRQEETLNAIDSR